MAEVQIAAMQVALDRSSQWQHFINLTGQDFPLKSRAEIFGELLPHKDTSFVSWFDPLKGNLWKNSRSRLDRYYLDRPWLVRFLQIPGVGHRLRRLLGWNNWLPHLPLYRRKWPAFFRYYGGANHVILNRDACVYLTTNPDALRIRRWLQNAAHTDEIIFQTVLLNGPLASSIVNKHFREIVFPSTDSPHPTTLTEADLPRLIGSPAFFARKFELVRSEKVMVELENRIRTDQALIP